MSESRQDDPRALLESYLTQLAQAGEKDICLSNETVAVVRSFTSQVGGRAGAEEAGEGRDTQQPHDAPQRKRAHGGEDVSHASHSSSGSRETPTSRKPSVRGLAAELPDFEPIAVRLALGPGTADPDMFVGRSELESCVSLEDIGRVALKCERCELAGTRTKVVFGTGDRNADVMFIGEAPGANEDREGVPFVGRAGALLNKIIEAAEFSREDVYICNILKCRPPNNRTPLSSEIEACVSFLARQIDVIAPRIICTLGLPATQTLLGVKGSMGSLRGKVYVQDDLKVIPTYHPAAALRDPKYKRPMWEDFLRIRREYDKL